MHRHDGFRELERQECLRLLMQVPIGRIIYTDGALPAVLPVNFALDHDSSVVLRTSDTSRMAHAVNGAVVAFEVDQFDETTRTGWSVIVTGRATPVTEAAERERLREAGLRSWVPAPEEVFIRIAPELVAGRILDETRGGEIRAARNEARASASADAS